MSTLVVFDLDGTLIRSVAVDAECFAAALREGFGLSGFGDELAHFEHVTDEGICREVLRREVAAGDLDAAVARQRELFVARLRRALAESASCVGEVPGAGTLIRHLAATEGWSCAVATGSWAESVRLKVRAAGLWLGDVPLATSDDAVSRVAIFETAVARATRSSGGCGFDRVVSVGDAVWDVDAARRLGVPFVGVTADAFSERLAEAGATLLLPDFRDLRRVRRALEEAVAPARA